MYIQETQRDNLIIIDSDNLSEDLLYEYFYAHKKLEFIHIESNGKYIGYINLSYLSKLGMDNIIHTDLLCKAYVVNENTNGADIHKILEVLSDVEVVAKTNFKGELISVYSRMHPESIDKDSLAMSILPAFQKEVTEEIKKLSNDVFIIADDEDKCYIKETLNDVNVSDEFNNNCLIITKSYKKFVVKHFYSNTVCISIGSLLEKVLLKLLLNYTKNNNIETIFVQGPIKEKLTVSPDSEPMLFKDCNMGEALKDLNFVKKFFLNDENNISRATNPIYGLMAGSHVISNGIHLVNSELHSEAMNINADGKRVTTKSIGTGKNIWCYGSCLTYGLFGKDDETYPSLLQELSNKHNTDMMIHNCGVKGSNNLLNDILYAFNTSFSKGDVLVFVSMFNKEHLSQLQQHNVHVNDFTSYLNQNPYGSCCFLDNTFHCNKKIYTRLAEFVFDLLPKEQKSSKIQHNYLIDSGKIRLIDYERSLGQVMYNEYINYITSKKVSVKTNSSKAKIGSMVITANPFTFGHAYLVDTAARECDVVYVFVVEENNFQFTFLERFKMVENYCKRYENVVVLESGLHLTPVYDFPEYFSRDMQKGEEKQTPTLHSLFFGKFIAKALSINIRYVGEELTDIVTMHFNEYLSKTLPQFGVRLVILKRNVTFHNEVISASYVRKCIKDGIEYSKLEEFLPATTINVIRERAYTFV